MDILEYAYRKAECQVFLNHAFDFARNSEVDTIVISAHWYSYFAAQWHPCCPGPLKAGTDLALNTLRRTVSDLVTAGKHVYLVLNIPVSPNVDPREMIHRSFLAPGFEIVIRPPTVSDVEEVIGPLASRLREVAREAGAEVIDPMLDLCHRGICPIVTKSGVPVFHDVGHLNPSYVQDNVRFLDRTILDDDHGLAR
jgi:hypothetical protein